MKLFLKIWRQARPDAPGAFKTYELENLHEDMSLLEALDQLNEHLARNKERVIAFDHDCREGICGQCGFFINGRAHGPHDNETTCQLHLRSFTDGSHITLEPFRAKAFPIVQDLVVDRSVLDRIIQRGGFISAHTGSAPEANANLISKDAADKAMDMAACIGCGACVAACKNASAALFTSAKLNHLSALPQGRLEAPQRTLNMVRQMEIEDLGHCSFTGACEVECPQKIRVAAIAQMNFAYLKARVSRHESIKSHP